MTEKKCTYIDILGMWLAQSKRRSVLFTFLPKNNRNEGQQWQRRTAKKNILHWELWLYILLRFIDDAFRNTSILSRLLNHLQNGIGDKLHQRFGLRWSSREFLRERLSQDFLTSVGSGGFSMSWYEGISALTSIGVRRGVQKLDYVLLCTITLKKLTKQGLHLKWQTNLKINNLSKVYSVTMIFYW